MSGIRRVQQISFEIDPVDVEGRLLYQSAGRPARYRAEYLTATFERGSGRVHIRFSGRRYLATKPGELTKHYQEFASDDQRLSEAKMAARRIAAAAAHKATGDPAGRRAS